MSNKRIEEMKQMKRRQELMRKRIKQLIPVFLGIVCAIILIIGVVTLIKKTVSGKDKKEEMTETTETLTEELSQEVVTK